MTDEIENLTEPTNDIANLKDPTNTLQKLTKLSRHVREASTEKLIEKTPTTESESDRDKRQIQFGKPQQDLNQNNGQSIARWSDNKPNFSAGFSSSIFSNTQHSDRTPFKPSAQIDNSYSAYLGSSSGNSQQFTPINTNNKFTSASTASPNYSPSGVPNFSNHFKASYSSNPFLPLTTTSSPLQYFSLKPGASVSLTITKAPPISSLASPHSGPFTALSGGFYNNIAAAANVQYSSKPVYPDKQHFDGEQPVIQESVHYDYEHRPHNQEEYRTTLPPPRKPLRYENIRGNNSGNRITSSNPYVSNQRKNKRQREKEEGSNNNYRATSNKGNGKNSLIRQRLPNSDSHYEPNNRNPSPHDTDDDDRNENSDDDRTKQEETDDDNSDDSVKEDDPGKGNTEGGDGENAQSPEIKPEFPDPPDYFKNLESKYDNVVNPFADPSFDFDTFISKIRTTHLSLVPQKQVEKLNNNIKESNSVVQAQNNANTAHLNTNANNNANNVPYNSNIQSNVHNPSTHNNHNANVNNNYNPIRNVHDNAKNNVHGNGNNNVYNNANNNVHNNGRNKVYNNDHGRTTTPRYEEQERVSIKNHVNYEGMSTPRPFSTSSQTWKTKNTDKYNQQSQTSHPLQTTNSKPVYEDDSDEYYDDDDDEQHEPVKNYVKPQTHQDKTLVKQQPQQYNNHPPTNYRPQANEYPGDNRKPYSNHSAPVRSQTNNDYRDEYRKPNTNQNTQYHANNNQKPTKYHASYSNTGVENPQNNNDHRDDNRNDHRDDHRNDHRDDHRNGHREDHREDHRNNNRNEHKSVQTHNRYNTDYRDSPKVYPVKSNEPSPQVYKKPPPTPRKPPSTQNNYRGTITTVKSTEKRRPIPKPSPEMNDYYYDDEDDDYDYEPPVKSKFMPSTEVKPQRPPIAQNYEEYEDYDIVDHKKVYKNKPSTTHKPQIHNETSNVDEDDGDEDDDEEYDEDEDEDAEEEIKDGHVKAHKVNHHVEEQQLKRPTTQKNNYNHVNSNIKPQQNNNYIKVNSNTETSSKPYKNYDYSPLPGHNLKPQHSNDYNRVNSNITPLPNNNYIKVNSNSGTSSIPPHNGDYNSNKPHHSNDYNRLHSNNKPRDNTYDYDAVSSNKPHQIDNNQIITPNTASNNYNQYNSNSVIPQKNNYNHITSNSGTSNKPNDHTNNHQSSQNVPSNRPTTLVPVQFETYSSHRNLPNPSYNANNNGNTYNQNTQQKPRLQRPEISNYEVQHSSANQPASTKVPPALNKPIRYNNQTTLRPYTVRTRLSKPLSTLSTYTPDQTQEPTKEAFVRHPTRASAKKPTTLVQDTRTFRRPTSKTPSKDNDNQETRLPHNDIDDNAVNRYKISLLLVL